MIRLVALLLVGLALAGCQSVRLGPYVAPRVTGQVVAADTGLPLADVRVARGRREPTPQAGLPPKGGELLMQKAPALTDRNGRYLLESERVLTLVRWGGWDSVRLTFAHDGYQHCETNYPHTSLTATNSPNGEPVMEAGVIRLAPVRKSKTKS